MYVFLFVQGLVMRDDRTKIDKVVSDQLLMDW